ncbi:MAG: Alkaline phosphatase PafA [Planctomycetes bacterium]|nr:Alkaline phosphatase PafA [Planctomycetota bacterium]
MDLRARAAVPLFLLAACGDAAAPPASAQQTHPAAARPRLAVVISVDQLRADYLVRFEDLFLPPGDDAAPGGFRYLTERGAWFSDAHHDHCPTYTGPGHAVQLTGAPPAVNGIVGNSWYDRAWKRSRYCVESKDPGGEKTWKSPETLLVTTVSDELEMATGRRSETWSFGLKDRAAILMGGHLTDGTFWFDDRRGEWQTSAFWGDDAVPAWLREWNAKRIPDAAHGQAWEFSAGAPALARLFLAPGEAAPAPFRHVLDQGKPAGKGSEQDARDFYAGQFGPSPFANRWVLDTVLECVRRESLGADDIPDVLTINLSSNDYVGHAFGPDSAEVLDITVQTDRALSAFFRSLAQSVPGGMQSVVVALTADHGVAPNPDRAAKSKLPAGRQSDDDGRGRSRQHDAAEKALSAAFGDDDWVLAHEEHMLYLNAEAFARHPGADRARAERIAADAATAFPGIRVCWTRTQILSGALPPTPDARLVALGFHPRVAGDVVIVAEPFWSPARGAGATHGSVWTYDTHVPLLLAGGPIRPGRHRARVSTLDLAPTLSDLLATARPNGSQGRVLAEALR